MTLAQAVNSAVDTRIRNNVSTMVIKDYDSTACYLIVTLECIKLRIKNNYDSIIIIYPASDKDLEKIKSFGGYSSSILIESI